MEPKDLTEKEQQALLHDKIRSLAEQYNIDEIVYDASFVYKPHFYFITTNLDQQIKEKAFKIFEEIFVVAKT